MAPSDPAGRRRLLLLAAAAAAPSGWPRWAGAQPRLGTQPFRLGVASGSPDHQSVVLWTRLQLEAADGPRVPVRWEVADDEGFRHIVQRGQAAALPDLGHAVHVEVAGLPPDRWYFYRFMAGDAVSPVGRTRTFPAPDAPAARLRLGHASCQRWEHGYFSAWRHLRAEHPDVVLFLGDYIYEYPTSLPAVRWPGGNWVTSLADYRERHALYKSDPDLQAMHAACPWLLTWDDHEVENNHAGLQEGTGGFGLVDFPARRAAAYQAYYENMPLRSSVFARPQPAGGALRLHAQVRFGRLADLLLLDTRQHRDPQACTRGGRTGASRFLPADCAEAGHPARSMLGHAQEAWLDHRLARPGAQWTILGQSTLFGRRLFRTPRGDELHNDNWDGYPSARARLTASLQRHAVANPVILGGDLHENWVGHVKSDYARPDSASIGVEFCGTSITSRPGLSARAVAAALAANPHYVLADARHRGYGLAEFTPAALTMSLRTVLDAEDRNSGVATLARFVVQAGRPALEAA